MEQKGITPKEAAEIKTAYSDEVKLLTRGVEPKDIRAAGGPTAAARACLNGYYQLIEKEDLKEFSMAQSAEEIYKYLNEQQQPEEMGQMANVLEQIAALHLLRRKVRPLVDPLLPPDDLALDPPDVKQAMLEIMTTVFEAASRPKPRSRKA